MNTSAMRQRASVALLIALVALVAACGERPEVKRQNAFARGEEYFKERKYNEAIIEYQNALQIDKEFVPALHALGRVYARTFWFLDASRELGRAHRIAPDSIDIAVDYGRSLVEVGDWEEADALAAAILAREPQNPHGFYIRAGALLGRAKAEEALTILDALQGSGALPEVEPARAEALFNLGRSEQAEQVLRNALAKDPGDARSLAGLGAIHLARKNYQEATRLYDEAKELRPDDPRIRLGLAASKARLGKVEEAIGELEQVPPRARTAVLVSALGIFYMEANRPSDAVQLLAPVVTQLPRLTQARFLLGLAYLSSNQPDQAFAQFEELERQIPNEPVVQLRLAQTESQLGRPKDALARLEPVAKALAEKPEYHLERSRCFAMLGRLDEATKAAEAAQRLIPNSPQ
ncbi:MAG TPA: tetratricopeptide repeat protein, partial [Candidatus Limnocylindrales bacterium]|nr:tetratricopeptide repeat protein [Candidatus Limnocylindrales bacterium]